MDQDNIIKIYARNDNRIQLKMIPGHFVTSQSHITHYLDLTTMKSRCAEAQRIASALAANYEASIPVDTIVCMDGLEVIGAYLAEELTKAGVLSMNAHQTIYVITLSQQHRTDDLPRQLWTNDQWKKHPHPKWFHHHRIHIEPGYRKRSVLWR